jgi:MFS family permease
MLEEQRNLVLTVTVSRDSQRVLAALGDDLMGRFSKLRLLLGINIFWLALSALSDGVNTLVLPARLLQLQGEASATTLGLVTFVGLLLAMLVQPFAGQVSDRMRARWGRRGLLVVGAAVSVVGLLLFGTSSALLFVLASYLLIQGAASVAQAAQQGFIPDLVTPETRGAASGLKSFMDLSGALVGFVVLGQLLAGGEMEPAVMGLAAIVLVGLLLTVVLVREPVPAKRKAVRIPAIREAFQLDLRRHRAFAWLVGARFLFLLGTYGVGRFLLLFVAARLGLDAGRAAEEAGMVLAGLTLVSVLTAIPAGWAADRYGRMPLMVLGSLLSAAGVFLLIWARSETQILLFGSLMGMGSAAFAGANWALTADLAPEAEAGRFFGLANVGTAGATAAAGLFGPLVDWGNRMQPEAGYTLLFVSAVGAFLTSILALRLVAAARSDDANQAYLMFPESTTERAAAQPEVES